MRLSGYYEQSATWHSKCGQILFMSTHTNWIKNVQHTKYILEGATNESSSHNCPPNINREMIAWIEGFYNWLFVSFIFFLSPGNFMSQISGYSLGPLYWDYFERFQKTTVDCGLETLYAISYTFATDLQPNVKLIGLFITFLSITSSIHKLLLGKTAIHIYIFWVCLYRISCLKAWVYSKFKVIWRHCTSNEENKYIVSLN